MRNNNKNIMLHSTITTRHNDMPALLFAGWMTLVFLSIRLQPVQAFVSTTSRTTLNQLDRHRHRLLTTTSTMTTTTQRSAFTTLKPNQNWKNSDESRSDTATDETSRIPHFVQFVTTTETSSSSSNTNKDSMEKKNVVSNFLSWAQAMTSSTDKMPENGSSFVDDETDGNSNSNDMVHQHRTPFSLTLPPMVHEIMANVKQHVVEEAMSPFVGASLDKNNDNNVPRDKSKEAERKRKINRTRMANELVWKPKGRPSWTLLHSMFETMQSQVGKGIHEVSRHVRDETVDHIVRNKNIHKKLEFLQRPPLLFPIPQRAADLKIVLQTMQKKNPIPNLVQGDDSVVSDKANDNAKLTNNDQKNWIESLGKNVYDAMPWHIVSEWVDEKKKQAFPFLLSSSLSRNNADDTPHHHHQHALSLLLASDKTVPDIDAETLEFCNEIEQLVQQVDAEIATKAAAESHPQQISLSSNDHEPFQRSLLHARLEMEQERRAKVLADGPFFMQRQDADDPSTIADGINPHKQSQSTNQILKRTPFQFQQARLHTQLNQRRDSLAAVHGMLKKTKSKSKMKRTPFQFQQARLQTQLEMAARVTIQEKRRRAVNSNDVLSIPPRSGSMQRVLNENGFKVRNNKGGMRPSGGGGGKNPNDDKDDDDDDNDVNDDNVPSFTSEASSLPHVYMKLSPLNRNLTQQQEGSDEMELVTMSAEKLDNGTSGQDKLVNPGEDKKLTHSTAESFPVNIEALAALQDHHDYHAQQQQQQAKQEKEEQLNDLLNHVRKAGMQQKYLSSLPAPLQQKKRAEATHNAEQLAMHKRYVQNIPPPLQKQFMTTANPLKASQAGEVEQQEVRATVDGEDAESRNKQSTEQPVPGQVSNEMKKSPVFSHNTIRGTKDDPSEMSVAELQRQIRLKWEEDKARQDRKDNSPTSSVVMLKLERKSYSRVQRVAWTLRRQLVKLYSLPMHHLNILGDDNRP